ncbi:MAG: LicD family protein, partial [Streptococcus sp.]|nr:LicD family protein [Streptococcus sp.]
YDLIDMPYENIVVKVPRKYHEILVYEFGENYMTPPPIEQQVPGGDKNYWID